MTHQSNKMQAALTRFGIYEEEEEKKETDKELSDSDNTDN
jgi:hypothetical protein